MSALKARSFECNANRSHIASENHNHKIKQHAWQQQGNLLLNAQQISTDLSLQERRLIEQIGTRIYGNKTLKG